MIKDNDSSGKEGYMVVQKGRGQGQNPVMNSKELKELVKLCTAKVLIKYKKLTDLSLAAAVLSAAIGESSAGAMPHFKDLGNGKFESWGRPSREEQRARGKLGLDKEECGMYRMNRLMIKEVAQKLKLNAEVDIVKMNSMTLEGDTIATTYMAEAYYIYNLRPFMVYQRHGKPVHEEYLRTKKVPADKAEDQSLFVEFYCRIQTAIEVNGLLMSNDGILPYHTGRVGPI
jgi:hypothetical protein